MTADRIDLVDEDDAGRALLRLLEHVAHTCRADTDEHLDEVGTGDREERHLGLTGDRLREQGLAGARRADQQHAARDPAAELLELLRVLQEVDQLLDLFLGFVATRDVGEGGGVVGLVEHACLRLAEAEGAALAAALHLAHEVDPDADQQQDRTPGGEDREQERRLFTRLDVELDAVVDQVADQAAVERGRRRAHVLVVAGLGADLGGAAADVLQDHALDPLGADFVEELGIADRAALHTGALELLEHGEEDQRDHQPDRDLRKPLIVHRDSISMGEACPVHPGTATDGICGRF